MKGTFGFSTLEFDLTREDMSQVIKELMLSNNVSAGRMAFLICRTLEEVESAMNGGENCFEILKDICNLYSSIELIIPQATIKTIQS